MAEKRDGTVLPRLVLCTISTGIPSLPRSRATPVMIGTPSPPSVTTGGVSAARLRKVW